MVNITSDDINKFRELLKQWLSPDEAKQNILSSKQEPTEEKPKTMMELVQEKQKILREIQQEPTTPKIKQTVQEPVQEQTPMSIMSTEQKPIFTTAEQFQKQVPVEKEIPVEKQEPTIQTWIPVQEPMEDEAQQKKQLLQRLEAIDTTNMSSIQKEWIKAQIQRLKTEVPQIEDWWLKPAAKWLERLAQYERWLQQKYIFPALEKSKWWFEDIITNLEEEWVIQWVFESLAEWDVQQIISWWVWLAFSPVWAVVWETEEVTWKPEIWEVIMSPFKAVHEPLKQTLVKIPWMTEEMASDYAEWLTLWILAKVWEWKTRETAIKETVSEIKWTSNLKQFIENTSKKLENITEQYKKTTKWFKETLQDRAEIPLANEFKEAIIWKKPIKEIPLDIKIRKELWTDKTYNTAQKEAFKALNPSINKLTKNVNLWKIQENANRANEIIIEKWYTPKDTQTRVEAHQKAMKDTWNDINEKLKNAWIDTSIDFNRVADSIQKYINENPAMKESAKWDYKILSEIIEDYRDLWNKDVFYWENTKQIINSRIKNWWEWEKLSNIVSNWLKRATKDIWEQLDTQLSKIPWEFQNLKNDYWSLASTFEDVMKANILNQRKKWWWLIETYTRTEWFWDIAEWFFSIIWKPKDVLPKLWKWITKAIIWKKLKKLRDPDYLIKKSFNTLQKEISPKSPKSSNTLELKPKKETFIKENKEPKIKWLLPQWKRVTPQTMEKWVIQESKKLLAKTKFWDFVKAKPNSNIINKWLSKKDVLTNKIKETTNLENEAKKYKTFEDFRNSKSTIWYWFTWKKVPWVKKNLKIEDINPSSHQNTVWKTNYDKIKKWEYDPILVEKDWNKYSLIDWWHRLNTLKELWIDDVKVSVLTKEKDISNVLTDIRQNQWLELKLKQIYNKSNKWLPKKNKWISKKK